jgi:predicted acetyltransferase
MEYRTLRIEELDDWFNLVEFVFRVPREYFEAHYYNDPWKDINSIFVAVDDGKLIGTVRVFKREIYYNNQILKMGGIGEVCVLKSRRGEGIPTILMEMAIGYMKDNDYDVSLLGTDKHGYYERFGYEKKPFNYKHIKVDGRLSNDYHIQDINEHYLDEIHELHHNFSKQLNGPIVRNSNDYYNKWFMHEMNKQTSANVIIDQNDELKGYIVYNIRDNKIKVKEFVCTDNQVCFDCIISHLVFDKLDKNKMEVLVPEFTSTSYEVIGYTENDNWMYKSIKKDFHQIVDENPVHFWSLDSY